MRDVIQVERQDGSGAGPDSLTQLARVADELLPPLVARLGVSDLGEIEVRQGTWRVRIRRAVATHEGLMATAHPAATSPGSTAGSAAAHASGPVVAAHAVPAGSHDDQPIARSTSVGYFGLRPGVAVGHRVTQGDALGWVDVLGVRMEIVAPADGVIERFVTEPGDPVEYGQELIAILAPTTSGAPGSADGADAILETAPA
jgi:biotin carboxyl carrier protein